MSNTLSEMLTNTLRSWMFAAPFFIASVVALIVSMVRWRSAPRASLLTLLGILVGLAAWAFMPMLYAWVPSFSGGYSDPSRLQLIYAVLRILHSCADALALILLVCGVYSGRPRP